MSISDAVDKGASARGLGVKIEYEETPPPIVERVSTSPRYLADSLLNGDILIDSSTGAILVESV